MSSPLDSTLTPVLSALLLNAEYTNDTTNGIKQNDLASIMSSLGQAAVVAAYLKRIDIAISGTKFEDIVPTSTTGANDNSGAGMRIAAIDTEAKAIFAFKAYMTHHVIKKAFNIGEATAVPTGAQADVDTQQNSLNLRMLYPAQKGFGKDWFNAISAYVFPKFNFKVKFTGATASNMRAVEVKSTDADYADYSLYGITSNSLTTFSKMASLIQTNNTSEVLTETDVPSSGVDVKSAIKIVTGLADSADQSGVTEAQLKAVLKLVSASGNLLIDLNNATDNNSNDATKKIPKQVIGAMTDSRLVDEFTKLAPDDLIAYVPATITPVVQRSQYDTSNSSKIYKYSNEVSRVDALVKLGGWSFDKLVGIYLTPSSVTTSSAVRTYLVDTTAAKTKALDYTGASATSSGSDVTLKDVFSAYVHYKQPEKFTFAALQTPAQIANWMSENGTSALLTTTPSDTTDTTDGVNKGANKYSAILAALATSDRPSSSLDVHFEALKLLAEKVSATSSNSSYGKSVAEIMLLWFQSAIDQSDLPSGITAGTKQATDFWNLPSTTSIEYAQIKFAAYVLTQNANFKMLEDPSNDKWFAKLVKVGASVSSDIESNGIKYLHGLKYGGSSTVTVDANGKPATAFGSNDQIQSAVEKISENESTFNKVKFYLTIKGAATTPALVQALYDKFGEANIVNLPSIPTNKASTPLDLISITTKNLSKLFPNGSSAFYAGFKSNTDAHKKLVKRMKLVSTLHDIITVGTVSSSVDSNLHLKIFDADDSSDFFKYHVVYANDNTDSTLNVAFQNIINKIMSADPLKMNKFMTSDSRAKDWRAAIKNHITNNGDFTGKSLLDSSDTTSSDVLRPSGSLKLRLVAVSIKTLLEKPLFIDPATQVAESRVTLANLIRDTSALSGKQGIIIFSHLAAITDGGVDNTKVTEDAYNNLVKNGILASDLINSVYSNVAISGFKVGSINFNTFVGSDEDGNILFDSKKM
jgi:hypothetical protein